MIETVWPYVAILLLSAGLFPTLERRYAWRLSSTLPPIVLTSTAQGLTMAGVLSALSPSAG